MEEEDQTTFRSGTISLPLGLPSYCRLHGSWNFVFPGYQLRDRGATPEFELPDLAWPFDQNRASGSQIGSRNFQYCRCAHEFHHYLKLRQFMLRQFLEHLTRVPPVWQTSIDVVQKYLDFMSLRPRHVR